MKLSETTVGDIFKIKFIEPSSPLIAIRIWSVNGDEIKIVGLAPSKCRGHTWSDLSEDIGELPVTPIAMHIRDGLL
jgi:hypothetical protein